ncbi:MAG: EutN/CcmL family microcompartment protein [Gaiellales bacterium]
MILCRVIGSAVSSRKDEGLVGCKLLVVVEIDPVTGEDRRDIHVAADTVGAGEGDRVLVTIGSAARYTDATRDKPLDALIAGIVDEVSIQ